MIADTNPWAVIARRVAALARRDPAQPTPPTPEVIVEALRVLVWLAGERAAAPHQVRSGPHGTVTFSWRQESDEFQVEVLAAGRIRWEAGNGDEVAQSGRRLDRTAADQLRSLIPLAQRFQPPRDGGA